MQIVKYTVAVAALLGLVQVDALRLWQQESSPALAPAPFADEPVYMQTSVAEAADAGEAGHYTDVDALVEDIETQLNVDQLGQLLDAGTVEAMNLEAYMNVATKFDAQFYVYHNLIRSKPQAFIPYLEAMLGNFNDQGQYKMTFWWGHYWMRTREGKVPVVELINLLKTNPTRPMLKWSDGLAKAARDLAKDQGPKGGLGHTGSDGSSAGTRINRYTKVERTWGENCMYGVKSPLAALMSLAIDDGIKSRGHRNNIFNQNFAQIGTYTGYHKWYRYETVVDYTGSYKALNVEQPQNPIPASPTAYTGFAAPQR